ncbi:NmrA family NAD(P)-binding protein [Flavisphingomonas formosensis]|uniref:NmrA family NAD(P)-binding protein n=1 Tax=Flavisphingomonas formosensis TaxID=861534 RepID=UPI0012FB2380|nr:NmrA family NAD(P)-binding protein [Sphingomonas formosensis]
MFAIMGATGKVGGAAARALRAAGQPVRAIVRDAAKGAPWAGLGCEIAVADLDAPDALARAFAGTEGVFAMLPSVFDPSPGFPEARAMIATLHAALVSSRPAHVVALSTIGADTTRPNLLNQLGLLEERLGTLPFPVTFLRPAWFIDNAAADVASARDEGVIRSYLQPLDRPVPMIAAQDVGHCVADLLREETHAHVVELEAAERVTPLALASAFSQALSRPVQAEAVPRARWEAIFREQGMRNPVPRMQMIDGFNAGWIDYPDRGAGARKGKTGLDAAIAALVAAA